MADENGSVVNTGNPAGDNAGADGNAQAQAAVPQAASQPPSWLDGLSDELKGVVQVKGWQGPGQVVESYRNLEKMVGQKGQPIPADDDAEGWNKFYNSLGRPEKPEDYKFDLPQEYNPDLVNFFSQAAHKVGLSKKQADAFLEGYLDFEHAYREEVVKRNDVSVAAAQSDLRQEWGEKYAANINLAARAVKAIGLEQDAQLALENSMGQAAFARVFQKIGQAICSEDSTPSNTAHGGFGPLTPAAAQARKEELLSRQDYVDSYMRGDPHKVREMEELNRQIVAGRPQG